jgi:mRNA guanylyltransferase
MPSDHLEPILSSFWVCEKSDGVRVLLLVFTDPRDNAQSVFLVRTRPTVVFYFLRAEQRIHLADRPSQHLSRTQRALLPTSREPRPSPPQHHRRRRTRSRCGPIYQACAFCPPSRLPCRPHLQRRVQETLRLLLFDCLVVDEQNVMSKTLDKRYGVSVERSRKTCQTTTG